MVLDVENRNGIVLLSHQSSFYDNEPNDVGALSMALIELMYHKVGVTMSQDKRY